MYNLTMKLKLLLKTKKAKIIACILVGILPATLMIIGVLNVKTELYYYLNPLKRPLYGFEIYKPTKLPSDLVIYDEGASAQRNDFLLWGAHKIYYGMNFDSNPMMNGIYETNIANHKNVYGCSTNSRIRECQLRQTPNGQEYKFDTEYGDLSDEAKPTASVSYVQKKDTIIRITNNYQYSRKWTDQEWDDLIDSLEVVNPSTVKFEYQLPPP